MAEDQEPDTNGEDLPEGQSEDDVLRDGTRRGLRRRPGGQASPSRVLAAERRRKAVALRLAGWTFPEIADALSYGSVEGARKAVKKAMKENVGEDAQELRQMTIDRLNALLAQVWPSALGGNRDDIIIAQRLVLDISRVGGADAPQQVDVNGGAGVTNNVLIVDGNKEDFILSLKAAAGDPEGLEAFGKKQAAAELAAGDDEDDEDIVDAEVIDDDYAGDVPPEVAKALAVLHGKEDNEGELEDG